MSDSIDPKKVAALEKRLLDAGLQEKDFVELMFLVKFKVFGL